MSRRATQWATAVSLVVLVAVLVMQAYRQYVRVEEVCVAFVQHLNLHWGEWGTVDSYTRLARAKDYSDYFSLLLKHPGIKHDISMPYWSLKYFEERVPDALEKLKRLVERGQVRIIDESWSPAVLPLHRLLIQEELLSINKHATSSYFSTRVEGVFLQESAAGEATPYILSSLQYSWTCLFQFSEHPSLLVGPDGSTVLNIAPAINTYKWYSPRNTPEEMRLMILRAAEKLKDFYSPLPPLVVISGDFEAALPSHTGVSLEVIDEAFTLLERDPRIRVMTVEEYLEEYGEALLAKVGEVRCRTSTWADEGSMIIWAADPFDIKILSVLLEAEEAREDAELLIALAEEHGVGVADLVKEFKEALPLLYEATGSDGEGWRPTCIFRSYILSLATEALRKFESIARVSLSRLAEKLGREQCTGECFLIFNQLLVRRSEWVELPVRIFPCRAVLANGTYAPCIASEEGVLVWVTLEPLEIVSVRVEQGGESARELVKLEVGDQVYLANDLLEVEVDRDGVVRSLRLIGGEEFRGELDQLILGGKELGIADEIKPLVRGPLRAIVKFTWRPRPAMIVEKYLEVRAHEPFLRVKLNITFLKPSRISNGFRGLSDAIVIDTALDGPGTVISQVPGGYLVELSGPIATPMRWHSYKLNGGGVALISEGGVLIHGPHPSIVLGKTTTDIPCEAFNGTYLYKYLIYPYNRSLERPMWVAERINRPPRAYPCSKVLLLKPHLSLEFDPDAIFINYFTLDKVSLTNTGDRAAYVSIAYERESMVSALIAPMEIAERWSYRKG